MPEAGRVIAGSARGIRLEGTPDGTRPLADRVKESLFASLQAEGALRDGFLDLFAGVGAAGIEALSRGASLATFVELNKRASALIEANLARAHLTAGRVVRDDVLHYLSSGRPARDEPYRAVIADPPYDASLLEPTVELLGNGELRWLADDAVVVAKHFWRDPPAEQIGSLVVERRRRFGETMLSFYRHTGKATVGPRREPRADRFARSSGRRPTAKENVEEP